jgi:hypothetical protein
VWAQEGIESVAMLPLSKPFSNWSLSNLASMLRLNLFTYRELTKWLHNPTETPPLLPVAEQLTLVMG